MATPLTQPVGAEVVRVDPELVALVGAERMRKYLASHLRALKYIAGTGGKVVAELEAKAGPHVVAAHCGPRQRV